MNQHLKRTFIASAALVVLFVPAIASAHEGESGGSGGSRSSGGSSKTMTETESHSTSPSPSPSGTMTKREDRVKSAEAELRDQLEQQKAERQAAVQDEKTEVKQKLDDAKKKICDNHQTQINNLMSTMDKRRQGAFDRITQVSEATQTFYTNNKLSVSNYDDLVAAITAAKSAAQATMQAQLAVPDFNCAGDHPRSDITDFRTKRADSIDAMKSYRESVRALVKAVKAAAESTKTESQS